MICRREYDMKQIGQNLRRLRISKKLSVEDVRKYLCLGSVQAIYKYEKRKMLSSGRYNVCTYGTV